MLWLKFGCDDWFTQNLNPVVTPANVFKLKKKKKWCEVGWPHSEASAVTPLCCGEDRANDSTNSPVYILTLQQYEAGCEQKYEINDTCGRKQAERLCWR